MRGHVTTLVLIVWRRHLAWLDRMSNMAGAGGLGGNGPIATISTHAAPSGREAPGHMSGQHCSSIHNPGTGWCGSYALCALHSMHSDSMHYIHCVLVISIYGDSSGDHHYRL